MKSEKELKTKKIKLGRYRHFKGKEYDVIGVGLHSESLEQMVIYRSTYGRKLYWVRPIKNFFEKVEVNGKLVPRYTYICPTKS